MLEPAHSFIIVIITRAHWTQTPELTYERFIVVLVNFNFYTRTCSSAVFGI